MKGLYKLFHFHPQSQAKIPHSYRADVRGSFQFASVAPYCFFRPDASHRIALHRCTLYRTHHRAPPRPIVRPNPVSRPDPRCAGEVVGDRGRCGMGWPCRTGCHPRAVTSACRILVCRILVVASSGERPRTGFWWFNDDIWNCQRVGLASSDLRLRTSPQLHVEPAARRGGPGRGVVDVTIVVVVVAICRIGGGGGIQGSGGMSKWGNAGSCRTR